MNNGNDGPRCGAKLRGKDATCRRRPSKGKTRCRLHGGASKPPAKGNANAVTHGAYRRFLDPADAKLYDEALRELMDDPRAALLKDAAIMRVNAQKALDKAQASDGLAIVEESEIQASEFPGTNRKRVPVMGPVSEVLHKAARITATAYDVDPQINRRRALERTRLETAAKLDEAKTAAIKSGADPSAGQTINVVLPPFGEPPKAPDDSTPK